ncbi:MAG: lipopolysaccharide kinase InaA family protein [bacterium]
MKLVIEDNFKRHSEEIYKIVQGFETYGEVFGNQDRNTLKLFQLNDVTANVKSFRVPNLVNKIVYRFFRQSKAERSFLYAKKLIDLNIGTPQPIAFAEEKNGIFFGKSYYISEHLDYDITYRELTTNFDYPDHENILRAFTRFTYQLHENQINFLDHSPGNTLIKKVDDEYQFYLVDLNRMRFEDMTLEDKVKNFAKLTIHDSMLEIMSDEYAHLMKTSKESVFNLMKQFTDEFQDKFHRKRRWKKRVLFWRK